MTLGKWLQFEIYMSFGKRNWQLVLSITHCNAVDLFQYETLLLNFS